MSKIFVQAAPGVEVPLEGAPKRCITADEPVEVTLSAYYRRSIADGDLIPLDAKKAKKLKTAADPAVEV